MENRKSVTLKKKNSLTCVTEQSWQSTRRFLLSYLLYGERTLSEPANESKSRRRSPKSALRETGPDGLELAAEYVHATPRNAAPYH